ncbi:hypothetical protein CSC94_15630 [Zhengella mangrovi]|uniref:DUF3450 domain-containing protein n=1 Tax=Zhengella mangrovi TaxID=1982044 RepID=A0A2G1QKN8_9HYPH|nr:hypothetical protein [Zhengella mangrovi]PHP66039.1 hypothetical protein CSC94_15630 [Zhengella mangrovi]
MARILRALLLALLVPALSVTVARAAQQDNVDYIVRRIDSVLNQSLERKSWKNSYQLVEKNIEDLKNTLRQGGTISSNPVQAYRDKLAQMMEERKQVWKELDSLQQKFQQDRTRYSQQAIRDIVGEMITRLKPRAGVLDPFAIALSKNMEVIKDDFYKLRTADQGIRLIDDYKRSILPAIHDMRDRLHGLEPLLQAYKAVSEPAGFEGTYSGRLSGGAAGTIEFRIFGFQVTGTVSGSYSGDPVTGSFTGRVSPDGAISTTLNGLVGAGKWDKPMSYAGNISGRITPAGATGTWKAGNNWDMPSGNWSATRR